ncbi:3-dehydroquinate synthase [Enterovirga sp. GCM10030262]|uniref:3-dehydroquinate synthase n=1 Tax=Enterovirga sp. GCM10030262 TaxID=3273391 RepID=UPI0036169A60
MTRVIVALGERSYDVVIEEGALDRASAHLAPFARDGRLIVVSDETVWATQGVRLTRGLGAIEAVPILVAPGEASKSWDTLAHVVDRLIALGIERRDHVVAFGGGVIGDLAGFAASIVNRGCGFVQIPTSLLAQVDSSVGGKTAINVPAGKNLVGAFHQPAFVLIDPNVLATLDPRQLRAGYAEIVKYALIQDAGFFAWLEENGASLLARNPGALHHAIATSVAGKARIVAEDERETAGKRALLNLGHTFGHALEAETGFSDRLLHGEAVAAGIVLAFDFSAHKGLCPAGDAERVRAHLAAVGLPTDIRDLGTGGRRLVGQMMHDKKKEGGRLPFILARGIGRAFLDRKVDLDEVEAFLDRRT